MGHAEPAGDGLVEPSAHRYPGLHALHATAPPPDHSPTRQICGGLAASAQLWPAGHDVQLAWPLAAYSPAPHAMGPAPSGAGHLKPAGHGVHLLDPSGERVPSAHGSISPYALPQRWPAGQGVQADELPVENVPPGHGSTSGRSVRGQYDPGMQPEHCTAPGCE